KVSFRAGRASSSSIAPHASEHRRIQTVGLCKLARRLSKTASLTRIDLDERNAGGTQRALECAMIRACWFEHDAAYRCLRQPFDECFVTALVVGEAAAPPVV